MPTTIAGNLIVRDGQVLLLYRDDHEYWELPGGKVESGETLRETAIREAKEELGVSVQVKSPWGRGDMTFTHEDTEFTARLFLSTILDGEPEPQEEKFKEIRWADEQALCELPLAPNLEAKRDHLRLLLIRDNSHRK